jgi:hypothetical protein
MSGQDLERFIQTSLREWAHGRPYARSDDRAKAIKTWTDAYTSPDRTPTSKALRPGDV